MESRKVYAATKGHCHFCGDKVDFGKRGKGLRTRGSWEIDHLSQRVRGGSTSADNCLPACTLCNRLRWHRTGAQIQELLELGLVAKLQIEKLNETGERLLRLRNKIRLARAVRSGLSVQSYEGDPVKKERRRQSRRLALIQALRRSGKELTAHEVAALAGVPKGRVKPALEDSHKVVIRRDGNKFFYTARPPKRR